MSRQRPVAYIDADILLHRAVSFVDATFNGQPVADWKQALQFFNSLHDKWMKQVGPTEDYHLVISVGPNFRKGLYSDYKANRKDIIPHPAFAGLKEEVMSMQATVWEDGIEADDLIGIRCSDPSAVTVAVSADKDFATVPCRLMIPMSHGRKKPDWHTFTEAEADRNWLIQSMTGDTIDNYKGIPKVGPVGAAKVLPVATSVDVMWEAVKGAFIAKGLTEEDALLQARLARILRHGEYNFETKEVQLWAPNQKKSKT